ncbi:MAG: HK97 family phage prohead protease [Pseudomonadota bacterium]
MIRIKGMAAVFDAPDLLGDRIAFGAFDESLVFRPAERIRMLWNHDPNICVGHWEAVRTGSLGLLAEGIVDQRLADVAFLANADLRGLSIGYQAVRCTPIKGGRRLLQVDLYEISLTPMPMHPGATFDVVAIDEVAA